MTANWTEWQGMVVDGTFYLDRYLGGTERSAVYFTDWGEQNKPAAIKLIAADADAESHLTRWKLASELTHPNLLRIYQAGRCELDGLRLLYVVMEYADENLADILRARALSADEAREMSSGVLEALAALHYKGLVHGHLKPSNIMAVSEQLKISSDSIARVGSSAACQCEYDAPELASEPISSSADIWSLGMTVVEALTQRRPGVIGAEGELGVPGAPAVGVLGCERERPSELPAPFQEIAQHCLLPDRLRRWTVAGIRAHLFSGQSSGQNASESVKAAQPVGSAGDSVVSAHAAPKTAQSNVVEAPLPDWVARDVEDEDNPPGVMEIFKPYVPVTVAAVVLLAFAAVLFTRVDSKEAQGRGAASSAVAAVPSAAQQATRANSAQHATAAEVNNGSTASAWTTQAPAPKHSDKQGSWVEAFSPQQPEAMSTSLSGALVPGTAIERPVPQVSPRARRTIHGRVKIKVKVAVDPSGSVERATLDSRTPSRYFADLAMEAARRWRFSPAQMNGQNVASEWLLKFEFRRARTDVHPTQLTAADRHL